MRADLHVHTNASDGTDSPQEVISEAAGLGLKYLAITDHDTVEGVKPAMEAGKKLNIGVLPAVELSTEYKDKEIHILGYLIDVENKALISRLEFFRKQRKERLESVVRRLKKLGMDISFQRVMEIAGEGSAGRPHIARAMMEKGFVSTVDEAFELFIGEGKPGYVPRYKHTPHQAIKLVRDAGGAAVLAHPGPKINRKLIDLLVGEGLQGIEVYHPHHKPEISKLYSEICKHYDLIDTGGSDYHGKDRVENFLGSYTVSIRVVEKLKKLTGKD